jgi:hypothetical protein
MSGERPDAGARSLPDIEVAVQQRSTATSSRDSNPAICSRISSIRCLTTASRRANSSCNEPTVTTALHACTHVEGGTPIKQSRPHAQSRNSLRTSYVTQLLFRTKAGKARGQGSDRIDEAVRISRRSAAVERGMSPVYP